MGCQCRLKEDWQQRDEDHTNLATMDTEPQHRQQLENGKNIKEDGEALVEENCVISNGGNHADIETVISGVQSSISSPAIDIDVDVVGDKAQPSSSGCSAKLLSESSKKDEKKFLIQRRITELREFLPPLQDSNVNSTIQHSKYKSTTLDTLNQLLDLLKNRISIPDHHDNENNFFGGSKFAVVNSAWKNFTELLNDAQSEDKDLINHKSAVIFELSEDGIVNDIRWNNLHTVLSWLEPKEHYVGKNFSEFIHSDSSCSLAFLQIISCKTNEAKCGYVKLKNCNVGTADSVISVPSKMCSFWSTCTEQTRRILATILPLAATWIYEPRTLSTTFYTKHSQDCRFIDVDNKVISSLGFLPQELFGRSFLNFITEESCDVFQSSHEQAVKACGKAVRSNAYQFVIRNGNQVTLQTEWCLFVNPWTKFVEFVMGCHTVVEGSQRRDVFANNNRSIMQMSEKASNVQTSVTQLLSQPLPQKHSSSSSQRSSSNHRKGGKCSGRNGGSSSYKTYSKSDVKTDDSSKDVNGKLTRKDMSTLFDRMVEHEYFMADAASVQEEFWKKGSPQGSFPASGEGSSRSPPESAGSGPTYNEIRGLANVDRLLKSQDVQSSDESTGKNHQLKSSSSSPANGEGVESVVVDVVIQQQQQQQQQLIQQQQQTLHADAPQALNSAILEALYSSNNNNNNNGNVQVNNMQINSMHRSQSAAADLDHCRTAVKLTSEILQTFTKEQERQHKVNWKNQQQQFQQQQQQQQQQQLQQHKRRFSVELQQVALKRALEPSLDNNACGSKISRPEVYRPASMPVIVRQTEPSYFFNPLNNVPWNINQTGKSNNTVTASYYRSLGPTPAPPPGKNFQITSAPLPVAPIDEIPLSPPDRQSAFAPLKKPTTNENCNSTGQQPINLSLRSDNTAGPYHPHHQTSIVQSDVETPEGGRLTWLNTPGASASIALQRMTQNCRTMMRDPQWPTGATARLIPTSSDDPFFRQDLALMSPTDINGRLLSSAAQLQQRSVVISAQNFNENSYYSMSNLNPNNDVSPIREATESLMILEDI